jgi:flagellar biosynthesis/type III secretory pathway protein FliH
MAFRVRIIDTDFNEHEFMVMGEEGVLIDENCSGRFIALDEIGVEEHTEDDDYSPNTEDYQEGFREGRNEGLSAGYEEGYSDGYAAGAVDAES